MIKLSKYHLTFSIEIYLNTNIILMSKLVFHAPVNSLSIGNVAVNLLREMYRRKIDLTFFPFGEHVDFKAYKLEKEFGKWFTECAQNRLKTVKKDTPSLCLWHIGKGSELKYTDRQYLMTFYELNSPTAEEVNLVNCQDHTFLSSTYSKTIFGNLTDKVSFVPMGFDEDFVKLEKKPMDNIHFGLMGKWEHRKHTEKIIKLWIKKYGDNPKYQLTCCVTNPFYKPEQMNQVIMNALGGKRYFNVNFVPYLDTNAQVNDFMNGIDIDLTGLAGAEGWNLPAFNCTGLGKWSIVLNATSHKDWATKDNSILVSPNGQIPVYDGIFFQQGQVYNQGQIYTWDDDEVIAAMELAEKKAKTPNPEGEKLRQQFSWANTLDIMMKRIEADTAAK